MKKIQLLFCLLLIPIIVSAQDVWQAKYVEIEQSIKVPNFKNKQYRITKFEALASALAAVNQKAFDTDNGCMADLGCTQDNHDHDYPSAENVAIDCLLGNICSEGWNSIAFPSVTMVEYKICNFITYWFTVTYNVYQRAVLNLVSFWYHYITFVIISLNFISYIFLLYF